MRNAAASRCGSPTTAATKCGAGSIPEVGALLLKALEVAEDRLYRAERSAGTEHRTTALQRRADALGLWLEERVEPRVQLVVHSFKGEEHQKQEEQEDQKQGKRGKQQDQEHQKQGKQVKPGSRESRSRSKSRK